MKFWQKVFLSVLVVFVIALNVGMFTVMHFTYKEQLNSVKQRAMGEAYFLSNSISKDFTNLEATSTLTRAKKGNIYDSYAAYYEGQNVFLELWSGKSLIGGDSERSIESREELDLEENVQNIIIRKIGEEQYLFLACSLKEPYENHTLVTIYPLKELERTRNQLIQIVVSVDIIITIILSGILYIIIRKLMQPLNHLSDATAEIAKGNYNQKISIQSEDEFGSLAMEFNRMSEKVGETIHLLKEESDKKQQLIDNMAHELRTPLTSISGYADYMRIAALSEEERIRALEYIIDETKRLEKLSKTLLLIADVREHELTKTSVPTKQLKYYVQNLFRKSITEKKIQFRCICEIETIEANEALLQLLLANLIENAIRACEEEGIITVTFCSQETPYIVIEDNGIGMEAEEIDKISEPFYRVDRARSRKNGGVGLGITLCQQIVCLHQGIIQYESEVNKGTRVIVSF
ncbi:sensor histidine kinase [Anaerosporobacter sp.]|uniref:sensor histidine kinase n=1 Tax=Anaerosporobacter sp. TaxID=1872529 RepID=UPI00286F4B6E|nr:HAMP domain-containing sensor histidine kinase [Anaerosporobacter sp.]